MRRKGGTGGRQSPKRKALRAKINVVSRWKFGADLGKVIDSAMRSVILLLSGLILCGSDLRADVTRQEAVEIAKSFVSFTWVGHEQNRLDGKDADGILVRTPPFALDSENHGVPYKWGGWDTPDRVERALAAGKAAGDMYSSDKRRLGGDAVSSEATGIDCSGLISRCWKLPYKHGTSTLGNVSRKLPSTDELKPGDIMNRAGAHVLLFGEWLDDEKDRALFYEAEPFTKVRSVERSANALAESGFVPMRFGEIRD